MDGKETTFYNLHCTPTRFGLQMAQHVCERADEGEQVEEAREVYLAIQGAIVNRSQHLLSLSENSCNEDTSGLMKGLTEREKAAFAVGQDASRPNPAPRALGPDTRALPAGSSDPGKTGTQGR